MLSDFKTHGATAGKALVNWWRAVTIEAFCCAILWLIGLLLIRVPLAPVWALIAGIMTFIPNFGPVIGLLGPVFAILLSGRDMERLLYLLGLYAVIVVIDQLLLQPLLMKRVTRVPDLGLAVGAAGFGSGDSVLGSAAGAAAAGDRLRLPQTAGSEDKRPPSRRRGTRHSALNVTERSRRLRS